ncbi:putative ABC transporter ATP-binding protein YknY [Alphaproteobacteria bacterium SO-S41]|nr:putative ABC transporter ATP-binding protein YknY [Alphaproteobacteria bacterium SO-S41]
MTAPTGNGPVLAFRDVAKVYGEGDAEVRALNGVSFEIYPGEFVAVMGASGSGKSTTLNILGCLDVPSSGSYDFMGVPVETLDRKQRALLRQNYLGFVFQGFNLLKRTTALENVQLPLVYRGTPARERRERAEEALRLVGLGDRMDHTSSELSGGQQQRVAIARALVSDPAVMLADEPTGNLDSQRTNEIMRLFSDLNAKRGITIILVTHEDEVAAYTKRHVRFRDGKIAYDGLPITKAELEAMA